MCIRDRYCACLNEADSYLLGFRAVCEKCRIAPKAAQPGFLDRLSGWFKKQKQPRSLPAVRRPEFLRSRLACAPYAFAVASAFNRAFSRLLYRDAVLSCKIPFCTLLSSADTVSRYCAWAAFTDVYKRQGLEGGGGGLTLGLVCRKLGNCEGCGLGCILQHIIFPGNRT